jgi:hypothetical protein
MRPRPAGRDTVAAGRRPRRRDGPGMPPLVTAADRASFRRCRRQWDFGAGNRQDLEPLDRPAHPDLDRAMRDALAVYYFPGMWDWDRSVRLPLVAQELERALARQRQRAGDGSGAGGWQEQFDAGRILLDRYVHWAPAVDRFAPVLVEADVEVNVLDPARPDVALVTPAGEPIRYIGRIDLLAVDAHDAYWIVRHRVVEGDWPPTEQLTADEEAIAACWAWEQDYIGMTITGTVYNELRRPLRSAAESTKAAEATEPAEAAAAGQPGLAPAGGVALASAAVPGSGRAARGAAARAKRRRPVDSPAPAHVRPVHGARPSRADRAADRGCVPQDLAAPHAGRGRGGGAPARRRPGRDDPRGSRRLPRALRPELPGLSLPRSLPGPDGRPRCPAYAAVRLPQAAAWAPGSRTARRPRLEPGPRRRAADIPTSPGGLSPGP